ncbi:MAG: NAD(P)H-dependent oxidoreductase [Chloroflexia bacterium]|nr:NAD(P)H-dependent oxidoreductase [Chloroflexia bacterium]
MFQEQLRLAIVIGSVREGRFGPTVANWFAGQARERDEFDIDVIDLADFDLPPSMASSPDVERFAERIGAADAVVVVTPEYNHSYPGPLKTAIDSLGEQWQAKPVGLVSYGGISGGLRAVEPLRVVFAELHAMTIRDTVSFHGAWGQFDDDGQPRDPEAVNGAARVMLDQLAWWARALNAAKALRPYGQKVAA